MNYEKSGLRLDINKENEDLEFREVFGITQERADYLDKKVMMAKSIMAIEKDIEKGLDYFMGEVKHPNEGAYCWLRVGQKCDCSSMGKVSAFSSDGPIPGGLFDLILKSILKGKDKPGL